MPFRHRSTSLPGCSRRIAALAAIAMCAVSPAAAQDTKAPPADTFTLGEIVTVLGDAPHSPGVGGSVISRDQIQTFERLSLDQAVNLAPGVVSSIDSN